LVRVIQRFRNGRQIKGDLNDRSRRSGHIVSRNEGVELKKYGTPLYGISQRSCDNSAVSSGLGRLSVIASPVVVEV
jgi:hypothetical protein